MSTVIRSDLLGTLLAGGQSRRYGSNKAFARVGGEDLARRAARTLEAVTGRVVLVANDRDLFGGMGLELRPDRVPGLGALGGIGTAVAWAREEGRRGALVLACDMPLVPPALLAELACRLRPDGAVVPASDGPRGLEPLCAAYGAECLGAIDRALDRGDRAIVSFFPDVRVEILDAATVCGFGDPDTMFFNVNRPEDRLRAEELLAGRSPDAPPREDG